MECESGKKKRSSLSQPGGVGIPGILELIEVIVFLLHSMLFLTTKSCDDDDEKCEGAKTARPRCSYFVTWLRTGICDYAMTLVSYPALRQRLWPSLFLLRFRILLDYKAFGYENEIWLPSRDRTCVEAKMMVMNYSVNAHPFAIHRRGTQTDPFVFALLIGTRTPRKEKTPLPRRARRSVVLLDVNLSLMVRNPSNPFRHLPTTCCWVLGKKGTFGNWVQILLKFVPESNSLLEGQERVLTKGQKGRDTRNVHQAIELPRVFDFWFGFGVVGFTIM